MSQKNPMRLVLSVVLVFALGSNLIARADYSLVARHLINKQLDSAYLNIGAVKNYKKATNIGKILCSFASYKDYIAFTEEVVFFNRNDYQTLVYFIDERVQTPRSKVLVDLDYVILQTNLTEIVANHLEISDAVERNNMLNLYLEQVENKTDKNFELAQLYANLFKALLGVIERDLPSIEQAELEMKRAMQLGDTLLAMRYCVFLPELFIQNNDIQGYIQFYKIQLKYAQGLKHKHYIYGALVDKLIDGLIFANYQDKDFIEKSLFELFNSPRYKYRTYLGFIRYFKLVKNESEKLTTVLQKLGYPDLLSFLVALRQELPQYLSNDDLGFFYLDGARLLFAMEEYELSSEFMYDMVLATKKTYSKDLSEAISDYKVRNLEREQDLLLSQEKEKNDIYLKFGVAFLVLFIFAVILAILLARRTNVLALRNNENETLINEKDLLMQEIHHRVKNNFELVSALLELQSYNIENKEVKEKIHAGQARIKSLSLIHNKLYESNESTSVDMQQYIFELTTLILKAADLEHKVELRIHANNIHLDIDTTVPIGLIINELVTNSCKYAFKGQGEWGLEISIEMQADGDYLLTYLEHNVDALVKENTQVKSGLGKMLIQNLVKQLRGKVTSDFANGAYYQIWFKDKLSRKKSD